MIINETRPAIKRQRGDRKNTSRSSLKMRQAQHDMGRMHLLAKRSHLLQCLLPRLRPAADSTPDLTIISFFILHLPGTHRSSILKTGDIRPAPESLPFSILPHAVKDGQIRRARKFQATLTFFDGLSYIVPSRVTLSVYKDSS